MTMRVEKRWSLQSNLLIEQNQYHHEKKTRLWNYWKSQRLKIWQACKRRGPLRLALKYSFDRILYLLKSKQAVYILALLSPTVSLSVLPFYGQVSGFQSANLLLAFRVEIPKPGKCSQWWTVWGGESVIQTQPVDKTGYFLKLHLTYLSFSLCLKFNIFLAQSSLTCWNKKNQ